MMVWHQRLDFDDRNDRTLECLPVSTEDSSNDGCIFGKFDNTDDRTLDSFPVGLLSDSKGYYFTGLYRRRFK